MMETQSSQVVATPTQEEEVRARWAWAEPSVWTDRMLAALENGVKGGKWFSLVDKVWEPESGTPQGAVISPLLANLYLNPLDHQMAGNGFEMVRYADDFVILCRSREEAENALLLVQAWVMQSGLTLHPEKTRIVNEAEGFDFLGCHFERGTRWPRRKSMKKFRDGIRDLTRRTNGKSMDETISRLNPKLRGWYGYFKHSHHNTFTYLDGWIRRRLRAILKKREGRRCWAFCKRDSQQWPNAYFHAQGLFSLHTAYVAECQSR